MEFQSAYDSFISYHAKQRSGPASDRIREGLQHAELMFLERVWWPIFHDFDGLFPEYELQDFRDGDRYLDFAYIQPQFKVAIEIDGFGPHWKNISSTEFADQCRRQNHLSIDLWKILRFAYLDVDKHPRMCQQTIQQLIGGLTGHVGGVLQTLQVVDREIVRFALGMGRPITAADVTRHLQIQTPAALRHLRRLVGHDWLVPASGSVRIRSYRIHPSRTHVLL